MRISAVAIALLLADCVSPETLAVSDLPLVIPPPAPTGYVYVPDPMPPLPQELYTSILLPDIATDLHHIAEGTMVNDQVLLRETGVMVDAKPFNVAISEQVFTPDRHVWFLNHSGFVKSSYIFGLDDSVVEMPKTWWFELTFYNLNQSTVIVLRRDLPDSATQPMIKFIGGATDPWFATILLFNHNGRLRIGPYSTNGAAVFVGMAPF